MSEKRTLTIQEMDNAWYDSRMKKQAVKFGFEQTLLMLLAMANSARHLEQLHDRLLPADRKLPNDIIGELKRFWIEYQERLQEWLMFLKGGNLTRYYQELILEAVKGNRYSQWLSKDALAIPHETILSDLELGAEVDSTYGVVGPGFKLNFDGRFPEVTLTPNFVSREFLTIGMTMNISELTEEFTHRLIKAIGDRAYLKRAVGDVQDHGIDLLEKWGVIRLYLDHPVSVDELPIIRRKTSGTEYFIGGKPFMQYLEGVFGKILPGGQVLSEAENSIVEPKNYHILGFSPADVRTLGLPEA